MLFGEYELIKTLGEGEFGKVKLARRDGQEVAIKLVKKLALKNPSKLMREIRILKLLDHPYIIQLRQVIETPKYLGIVMDYYSGGELFQHILTKGLLKEAEAKRLFSQLVSGTSYLHSIQIVHRDLKLENLLLDKNRNIIIVDFGFACHFSTISATVPDSDVPNHQPSRFLETSCGSPCYAAPELVINQGYVGELADIWSLGVILHAMLTGYLPFDDDPMNPGGDNINLLYKYIVNTRLVMPKFVAKDACDLVIRTLVIDPKQRAGMLGIMEHRWLQEHRHFYQNEQDSLRSLLLTGTRMPVKQLLSAPGAVSKTHAQELRNSKLAQQLEPKVQPQDWAIRHSFDTPISIKESLLNPGLLAPLPPKPLRQGSDTTIIHDRHVHSKSASASHSTAANALSEIPEVVDKPRVKFSLAPAANLPASNAYGARGKSMDLRPQKFVDYNLKLYSGPIDHRCISQLAPAALIDPTFRMLIQHGFLVERCRDPFKLLVTRVGKASRSLSREPLQEKISAGDAENMRGIFKFLPQSFIARFKIGKPKSPLTNVVENRQPNILFYVSIQQIPKLDLRIFSFKRKSGDLWEFKACYDIIVPLLKI